MVFNELANNQTVSETAHALQEKGYEVFMVNNGIEALEKIKVIIPEGMPVMNGSSVTLEQIGYIDYLKSDKHKWNDLHAKVTSEPDKDKRSILRKQSSLSDYYLGSVHALTETGDFIVASNTGSQLPHLAFTSQNLVLVVSTKKIVKTLDEGLKRLKEYVVPLEDKHMQDLYKQHTALNKILISNGEAPMIGRKITFILVEENLGF